MEDILKIAAAAVAAAVCAVVVKQRAQEVGLVLSLAAGALVPDHGPGGGGERARPDGRAGRAAGLSPAVLAPVLKTVGIAILTHISAEVCRDAKESGIAAFVETAGAAVALCVALPLLRAVLDTVTGLL